MPIIIASKTEYTGTVYAPDLNVETIVIEITAQSDSYIVGGWIDLGALDSSDAVIIRVYVAVDGTNYRTYATASYSGPVSNPVVRIHEMQLCKSMKYKVTITQTAGIILKPFPYGFILEVMGST